MKPNPYLKILDRTVDVIMKQNVATLKRDNKGFEVMLKKDNDWIYPDMGGSMALLAYAWSCPQSAAYRRRDVWRQMVKLMDRVLGECRNGRWWRRQPRTGDQNIDRFTLLPLLEAYLKTGTRLDAARRKRCLSVIAEATDEQVDAYPKRGGATRYPNMDAYFMLIMAEASRVLERTDLHELSWQYAGYLESMVFPGGGFSYYKGTNECEIYHSINVLLLTRYYEMIRSQKILDILRKTLPYYPNSVEPSGVADYYTDPCWKHPGNPVAPFAPEVMATLFPDAPEAPQHRYLANVLRKRMETLPLRNASILMLYAIDYWRDAPGRKPRDQVIRYDHSIRGPRGRFGAFSWGATTGHFPDTFVGALLAETPDKISALDAAGADVLLKAPPSPSRACPHYGRRHGLAAYVAGWEYFRRTITTGRYAAVAVSSPLFPGQVAWDRISVPDSGWNTQQVWWLDGERLVGLITVAPGEKPDPVKAVRIYFRLGGPGNAIEKTSAGFSAGDLRLRLVAHNLGEPTLEPGYKFLLETPPSRTEVVLAGKVGALAAKPAFALAEIYPKHRKPVAVERLEEDAVTGFVLGKGARRSVVALNTGAEAQTVAALRGVRSGTWTYGTPDYPNARGRKGGRTAVIEAGQFVVARS